MEAGQAAEEGGDIHGDAPAGLVSPTAHGPTLAQKRRLPDTEYACGSPNTKLRMSEASAGKAVAMEEATLVMEDSASG